MIQDTYDLLKCEVDQQLFNMSLKASIEAKSTQAASKIGIKDKSKKIKKGKKKETLCSQASLHKSKF